MTVVELDFGEVAVLGILVLAAPSIRLSGARGHIQGGQRVLVDGKDRIDAASRLWLEILARDQHDDLV
ncbi:hypothetical protein FHW94_003162 [Novosphingobium sp. SG720]|nr:hypothetical protein [Novosphingobium sp. SG720]